jgi:UDP:flavonoid glycosyltransferase YjiC (YdhE family)
MKKRIILTTFGSFGDINPYLAITLGLKERGHRPVLATSEFYRSRIEGMGVEFHPVRPDIDLEDIDAIRRIMHEWKGPQVLVREYLLPHLYDSYNDLLEVARDADLILTHPITYAGPIVAEKYNIPWASAVIAPISLFSAYDPPIFPGTPWMTGFARLGPAAGRIVLDLSRLYTRHWMKPLYRFRRDLGLARGQNPIFEGQYSPYMVLALFPEVLAGPQPDWPPNTVVCGYPFLEQIHDEWRMPEGLHQFLEDGPQPIVFTLGSSAVVEAGAFYSESLEVARSLGSRAVLLTGPVEENVPQKPHSDDVFVCQFAPYSKLFPRCRAVVSSAGMGTISEGLRAGRPMLFATYSHDQPDNADHVRRLGMSEYINRRLYNAKRAIPLLEKLLDEGVRAKAEEIGIRVSSEDGVANACDALEKLLNEA